MQSVRLVRILFGVTISLFIFALVSPTQIVQADTPTPVPCFDGEPDGIKDASKPFPIPQDPNVCRADDSQSSQESQDAVKEGKMQWDQGVPYKTPQAPISIGQKLNANDKDNACLDFNGDKKDGGEWNGTGQNQWYASWGIQAFNQDGVFYKENASFQQDWGVGDGYSMKIAHGKPFRAQIISPEFEVPAGARVVAKVSYYIREVKDNSVWVELSVHTSGDQNAPIVQGYFNKLEQWTKLSSNEFTTSIATKVQVSLQAVNMINQNPNIYFDNIEIWVDGLRVKDCSKAGKLITVGVPVPKTGTPTPPDTTVLGVADVAKQNTSVVNSGEGEILIHSNDILDRNRAKKVGSLSIYCLSAGTTNKSVCKWFVITITLNDGTLNDGTLTVAGTGNINNGGNLPVIGGTGSYAKINGYVTLSLNNGSQVLRLAKR